MAEPDHKLSLQKPSKDAPEDIGQGIDIDINIDIDLANVVLDPQKERKLLLKLDLAFVPIIMVTYLSCFLDRTNI
ncbi:hypothetical protein KXX06_005419, partial [Aspergillus fumigatus]